MGWRVSHVEKSTPKIRVAGSDMESLITEARILGRTEAMDHMYSLVKQWRRTAKRYKNNPEFTTVFNQCAEMLENKIEEYSNS